MGPMLLAVVGVGCWPLLCASQCPWQLGPTLQPCLVLAAARQARGWFGCMRRRGRGMGSDATAGTTLRLQLWKNWKSAGTGVPP